MGWSGGIPGELPVLLVSPGMFQRTQKPNRIVKWLRSGLWHQSNVSASPALPKYLFSDPSHWAKEMLYPESIRRMYLNGLISFSLINGSRWCWSLLLFMFITIWSGTSHSLANATLWFQQMCSLIIHHGHNSLPRCYHNSTVCLVAFWFFYQDRLWLLTLL